MQGTDEDLPGVGLKKLKKMLKRCRTDFRAHEEHQGDDGVRDETRDLIPIARCQGHCQGISLFLILAFVIRFRGKKKDAFFSLFLL